MGPRIAQRIGLQQPSRSDDRAERDEGEPEESDTSTQIFSFAWTSVRKAAMSTSEMGWFVTLIALADRVGRSEVRWTELVGVGVNGRSAAQVHEQNLLELLLNRPSLISCSIPRSALPSYTGSAMSPSNCANLRIRANVSGSAVLNSLRSAAMLSTALGGTRASEPISARVSLASWSTRARLMGVSSSATPMTDMGSAMYANPANSPACVLLLPVQCTTWLNLMPASRL